jgi:hypothetical protein
VIAENNYSYSILKAVYQIEDQPLSDPQYLHYAENDEIFFDVFAGLPFDYTYHQNKETEQNRSVTITNSTTTNVMFELPGLAREVTRVGIIDKNGVTLQQYGVDNNLELSTSFNNEIITTCGLINPKIRYHEECEGTYIKWLNTFGGWDYWLFSNKHGVKTKSSSVGSVNVDFDDIINLESINASLGKTVEETHELNASFLSSYEFNKLVRLGFSPKVYLWTGSKFAEVELLDNNSFIANRRLGSLDFSIRLTERQTQKI